MNITPVILCGGYGSRIWPLSRKTQPKQFIKNLVDKESLFQQTIKRIINISKKIIIDRIIILTNEENRFQALEQITELQIKFDYRIILEPISRNTAPALTLASLLAIDNNKDSKLIVLPSDHFYKSDYDLRRKILSAVDQIRNGEIFLFGIKPKNPNPNYGYIKFKEPSKKKFVSDFVEKPNEKEAIKYLNSGKYLWNSGIFLLHASTWLKSINISDKKIYEDTNNSWLKRKTDGIFIRPSKSFSKCKKISIDYVVIQNYKKLGIILRVMHLNSFWSDIGTFKSLNSLKKKNSNVISYKSKNNMVFTDNTKVCLFNVKDLIVVNTRDVLMILNINDQESIKKYVDIIYHNKKDDFFYSDPVYRKWGHYLVIEHGNNFIVKKIVVNPYSSISLQLHNFRNEHWVVVEGKGTVIKGEMQFDLNKHDSVFINKKEKHQLINNSSTNLVVIETQIGEKISETDILRFNDKKEKS